MKKTAHSGSTYLLVVVVFLLISLFTTMIVSSLNQTIYHMNAYALQSKAYYLNREAQDAVVAVLLDDQSERLKNLSYPCSDSMTHTDESGMLGKSEISLSREFHEYYSENEEWVVARIVTTIPDVRGNRAGEPFTYTGTVMILLKNPIVQLYNISPESL